MQRIGLVQDAAGGAQPTLYAATAPDLPGGSYVGPSGWMEQTGTAPHRGVLGRLPRPRHRSARSGSWPSG